MGDKRNFAALEWVVGEISETLREARHSLEAYVEDPKDTTRIRFCLTHIHQVQGSLQMVEFHGAALLAEEMEHTAQAIMNNAVSNVGEAQEVLMRGLLQLPTFLDHIKTNRDDNPAVILPLLNDLRAVRKESYLSETNLFSPDLSQIANVSGAKHAVLENKAKLKQVLHKLREMYQFAAASVLRGIKIEDNFEYIDKVVSRLELLSRGTKCHPTWEISAALVDGLKRDEIELTVAVRGLLRYIARELRILGDKAPNAMDITPKESLLKNLLFYVARAEEGSERVAQVKQKYGLDKAHLGEAGGSRSGDVLQTPDNDAIKSVVVALQEELSNVKNILDLSLTGQGSVDDLKEILPTVKRIADTLAILGIGDLRKQMIEQNEQLEALATANSIDEDRLMHVAGKIIEIEQRLQAIGKSVGKRNDLDNVNEREVEIDTAKAAVISECISGLEKVKEAITEYMSSQWDVSHLSDISELMTNIRGGLNMIPLRRSAEVVRSCGLFIEEKLVQGGQQPDASVLLSLPDAIVSVEYYLERLTQNIDDDAESFLDIAEESVEALGYPVEETDEDDDDSPEAKSETVEVQDTPEPLPEPETNFEEVEAIEEIAPVQLGADTAPVDEAQTTEEDLSEEGIEEAAELSSQFESDLVESEERVEPEALEPEAVEPEPVESHEEELEPIEENIAEPEPVAQSISIEDAEDLDLDDNEDIDEEIIEIFIEEAGEVLETLQEFFPLWRQNEADSDSLVVIRRAFHTLKGSGRMVEAYDIGELAWAIENMLNRVIDRTISVQPQVFHLIESVMDVVPTLVKAFENRKKNPIKDLTEQYANWAHQVSEGNFPPEIENGIPEFSSEAAPVSTAPVSETPAVAEDSLVEQELDDEEDGDMLSLDSVTSEDSAEEEIELNFETDSSDDEIDEDEDAVLSEIFSSESMTHLHTIEIFIKQMEEDAPLYSVPSDSFQRALHTLKGSAKMAQVWPIAEITEPLENFAKELISYQIRINDDILQLIRDAVEYTRIGLKQIRAKEPVNIEKIPQFVARAEELRQMAVGHLLHAKHFESSDQKADPRMLSLVMAEEMALLLDVEQILKSWQHTGQPDERNQALINELKALEEGGRLANLPVMASLSAQLIQVHERGIAHQIIIDDEFFSTLHKGHDALLDMVDAVAAGQNVVAPHESVAIALNQLLAREAFVEETPDLDLSDTISADSGFDLETADEAESTESFDLSDVESEESLSFDFSSEGEEDQEIDFASLAEPTDLDQPVAEGEELSISFGEESAEETASPEGESFETEFSAEAESEEPIESFDLSEEQEEGSLEFGDLSELEEEGLGEFNVDAADETPTDLTDTTESETLDMGEIEPSLPEIESAYSGLGESADSGLEESADSGLEESAYSGLEESAFSGIEESTDGEDASDSNELEFEGFDDIESESFSLEESDQTLEPETNDQETPALESSELDISDLESSGFEAPELESSLLDSTDESTSEDSDASFVMEGFDESDSEQEDEFADLLSAGESSGDEPSSDSGFVQEEHEDQEADVSDELDEVELDFSAPAAEEEKVEESAAPIGNVQVVAGDGQIAIPGLIDVIDVTHEDFDADILEVFLDEAQELSEELDESIHTWESNWSDTESVESVKRVLHTLKGGARLAGLGNLGQLTHEYESYLIGVDVSDIDDAFFKQIHGYQDSVLSAVRAVKAFMDGDTTKIAVPATVEEASPEAEPTAEAPQVHAPEPVDADSQDQSNVVKFSPKPKPMPMGDGDPGEFIMPSVSGGGGGAQAQVAQALKKAGPQEVVKVSAELLEELVNLAGETSISRARLEQQISDFGFAIDEIDATLHRLQEQLRRLDIETEAQVLFRQEQMEQHEDFDPLEMDRYSHMQQLSRSLIESASDLVDLKSDLSDKLKDTETLLIQQQRINTNLQEGLMRSRMVPFSRLVPRLRRIVRQVATELGKSVSFELDNIEGELDRSVLERMVPPFEHMLRNAVDHGIESPEDREAAGKPESGRIVLTLGREGGDVIIRLADDGRGIDLRRVREKAIERELMSADSDLSDHDIMQFILHAGFSTAENVTQISGRGVGMDVVHAEIKQLGGAVSINSAWGKGTEFIVRLPFTLSVNRALMVDIGGDNYAVPLSTIEGIVRVSPFELEHYYSNPEANFEYANETYQVRYLGSLLNTGSAPKLEGQALPLPVLLVRSAEHTMAVQVDALLGSREIVVKTLGQQFSLVSGLSGATVMGDGSVVVILDPHALVRQEIARANLQLEMGGEDGSKDDAEAVDERVKTVMVVDDSVTVRKVTTRFLEREGFNVTTAKDGVDALRVLQEGLPDLMLLDIEMPRMDGFEVAKTIRTTQRWENLPIIMITSRTGDKHREHALSLGVNKYLGKPYQEDLLLESIAELLEQAKALN